jgi:hypothetical protein
VDWPSWWPSTRPGPSYHRPPTARRCACEARTRASATGLAARCRLALAYARPVAERDPGAVRCSGQTLYASLLRIDDEVLVNTHFWGNPANASPVLHLRRQGDDGVAANAQRSFERVWASSSAPPGAP